MAKKNILIKTNNAGAWDELYPITAAGNVKTTDGSDVEAQLMGNRTIDQALTSPSNTGTITKLFSWIAGRIKGITGKNNWYDAPATTIEELNSNRISKTLITAANDFIVGSANATVAKKTLAETKTILGVNGASESATGVVELATAAETTAGTDNTRAVHPAGLKVELDKKVDKSDAFNSIFRNTIANGTDFNTVVSSGNYLVGDISSSPNRPPSSWGVLVVEGSPNNIYITQTLYVVGVNSIYFRTWDSTVWTAWSQAITAVGGAIPINLKLTGIHALNINSWGDISAGNDGMFLLGQNCYKNASNNKYYYSNTHASMGARGIVFQYGADATRGVYYFDTGSLATTADTEFTPAWLKILDNAGRLIARNGTDYTTPQVRNVIESTADPSSGANGDIWIKYKP